MVLVPACFAFAFACSHFAGKTCNHCGNPGHFIKACPLLLKNGSANGGGGAKGGLLLAALQHVFVRLRHMLQARSAKETGTRMASMEERRAKDMEEGARRRTQTASKGCRPCWQLRRPMPELEVSASIRAAPRCCRCSCCFRLGRHSHFQ